MVFFFCEKSSSFAPSGAPTDARVAFARALTAACLLPLKNHLTGVLAMIQEAETGRRVPPAEMETCQEAISVAYALLQRHPGTFLGKRFDDREEDDSEDDEDDQDALSVNPCRDDASPSEHEEKNGEEEEKNQDALRAASSLIASLYRALQGSSLSREAAVSAGVTVAAAVGAGIASDPKRHAAALADAFVGCDDDDDSLTASDAASAESSKVSSKKNFDASSSSWCRANGVDPAPTESLALATLYQKTPTPTTFARLSDAMHPFGRLCAARGVLTAASAEALAFPLEVPKRARRFFVGESGRRFAAPGEKTQADGKPSWTLLTSYLLPYICASLERPEDSHHKYHAAAALRAALVRVKALAASGVRRRERSGLDDGWFFSLDEAFPAPLRDRVCAILWANWEDPLSQTVKETHLSFETLLDIEEARGGMTGNGENKNENAFLEDAARSLLKKDASRKGRYVPLAAVARRLGAKRLLSLAPDLLAKTLSAMKDDSVCTAAGALVAAVSQSLLFETTTEEEDADARINETALPGAEKSRAEKKKPRRAGKDETTVAAAGSPKALASWRAWWVGPMTDALLSAGKQRAGVGTYALPAFLKQDGASVVCLLARIQESASCASSADKKGTSDPSDAKEKTSFTHRDTNSVASAVVAVLRSARALGLLDPEDPSRVSSRVAKAAARTFAWRETSFTKTSTDDGKVLDDDISYGVAPDVLLAAATRRDARSRRDALDLLCVDGKRFSLPGALERAVLRAAIPTHLRDADAAFRGALVSSLTHLMSRIKAGCLKAAAFARARPELFTERGNTEDANANAKTKDANANAFSNAKEKKKTHAREKEKGARRFGAHVTGVRAVDDDEAKRLVENALACVSFTEWLTRTLVRSAYPGAPYERKQTALDLLLAVAETFPPETSLSGKRKENAAYDAERDESSDHELVASRLEASPYATLCLGPDVVTCLLGAAVDSWDKLRVCAFRLLSKHPAPLAGIDDADAVAAHFAWALALSRSPRVRESDAAALLLRLLFRKYALDGGWTIALTPETVATPPAAGEAGDDARNPKKSRRTRTAKLLGASPAKKKYLRKTVFWFFFRRRTACFSRTTNESEPTDRPKRKRKRLSSPDARKHILEYVLVLSERIGEVTTRAEDGGDLFVRAYGLRFFVFLLAVASQRNARHPHAFPSQARCAT